MNKGFLALTLALFAFPISALAQDAGSPPSAPTADQRQQMHQALTQAAQQEEQLYQQMRRQVLSSLSQSHRRAIAAEIGNLAIAPSPDPQAAAKRIDAMLSAGEQQSITQAHANFLAQSRQIHDQLRTQMQGMMPDHPPMGAGMGPDRMGMAGMPHDAGSLALSILTPHPMMPMMMHAMMMHGMGPTPPMGPTGAPPQP